MVVAIYKSNGGQPEQIRVHKGEMDGKLRVEAVSSSYAMEVGGVYETKEDVEKFLAKRDRRGYTLVVEHWNRRG